MLISSLGKNQVSTHTGNFPQEFPGVRINAENQALFAVKEGLKDAADDYDNNPNAETQARLIEALNQAIENTQAEHTHITSALPEFRKKMQEEKTQNEQLKDPGLVNWVTRGVKSVFSVIGESYTAKVERYTQLANKREEEIQGLTEIRNQVTTTKHKTIQKSKKITQTSDDGINLQFYYNLVDTAQANGKNGATFRVENKGSTPIVVTKVKIKTNAPVTAFYPNKGSYSQVSKIEPTSLGDGNYETLLTFDTTPFTLDVNQICEGRLETNQSNPGIPFTFSPKDNGGVTIVAASGEYTAGISNKNIAAGPGNDKIIGTSLKKNEAKAPNFDNIDPISLSVNTVTYESLGFDSNSGNINYAYTDGMGVTSFESFCQRNQNSATGQRLLCGPAFTGEINNVATLITNNKLSDFVSNIKTILNGRFSLVRFDFTSITTNNDLGTLFKLLNEAKSQLGNAIKIHITLPGSPSIVNKFKPQQGESDNLSAVVNLADNVIVRADYNLVGTQRTPGLPAGAVSPIIDSAPFNSEETITGTQKAYNALLAPNLMKKLTPPVNNQCVSSKVESVTSRGGYASPVVSTPNAPVAHDCVTNTEAKSLCPTGYPSDLTRVSDEAGSKAETETKSVIYSSSSTSEYVNCPSEQFPNAVMSLQDWGGLWLSEAVDPVYTGLLKATCNALSSNCPGSQPQPASNDGTPIWIIVLGTIGGLAAIGTLGYHVNKKVRAPKKGEKEPLLSKGKPTVQTDAESKEAPLYQPVSPDRKGKPKGSESDQTGGSTEEKDKPTLPSYDQAVANKAPVPPQFTFVIQIPGQNPIVQQSAIQPQEASAPEKTPELVQAEQINDLLKEIKEKEGELEKINEQLVDDQQKIVHLEANIAQFRKQLNPNYVELKDNSPHIINVKEAAPAASPPEGTPEHLEYLEEKLALVTRQVSEANRKHEESAGRIQMLTTMRDFYLEQADLTENLRKENAALLASTTAAQITPTAPALEMPDADEPIVIRVDNNSMATMEAKRMVSALNTGTSVTLQTSAAGSSSEQISITIVPVTSSTNEPHALPNMASIAAAISASMGTQLSSNAPASPKLKPVESKTESSQETGANPANAAAESKRDEQNAEQTKAPIIKTVTQPAKDDSDSEEETETVAAKKAPSKRALVLC